MPRWAVPAAALLAYVLLFHGLGATGLLGPDEPRYASIGREMARSGDWVTPRLWGEPWFEKPALLYWMTAAGFRLGLGEDLAPRLPVALLSAAFLVFFGWRIATEFGARAGWFAALILATTGGWLGYSAIGVTDLPLAAMFGAALLLALPWVERGDARLLPWAAACLGGAALAKGLVPLVLSAPAVAMGLRHWRGLLGWRAPAAFLLVAGPWYWLCWRANGRAFTDEFFLKHHFGRFASEALQHVQPWWFYLPVLAAALLPWTPLVLLLRRTSDRRLLALAASVVWGFVFFSASTNKLPGYLLPLLPACAALLGVSLDRAGRAGAALASCGLLLAGFPLAAQLLPAALASGLSRAPRPVWDGTFALAAAVAAAAWALERKARRVAAAWLLVGAAACGVLWLKGKAYPALDRAVSARGLWREIEARRAEVCVEEIHRGWRYGLNYYSVTPLPACEVSPLPLRVGQESGDRPAVR